MEFLKNIYKNFVIGDLKNTEDVPDVDAWMSFLDSLPTPADAVSQSYNKYLCRAWYIPKPKALLLNILAFFGLLAAMPRLVRKGQLVKAADADKLVVVTSSSVPYADVIPAELEQSHAEVVYHKQPAFKVGTLTLRAKAAFVMCAKAHPISFYYLYYTLKELSLHSELVRTENPHAVAVYVNERNFAGPVLRMAYEEGGREFDSFMHGEYLLQLIHGYMSFTNFYVWDDSYKDMFEKALRCDFGACISYKPKKLQKKWNLEDVEPDHFLTYYFSGESTTSIKKLSQLFMELEGNGLRCVVRPHPRYSHLDLISQEFPSEMIEDANLVSMEDSLGRAEYIVGLTTTVLFEAKAEGKKVVLDDCSDPDIFQSLQNRKFRLLNEEHLLLSELIRESARCD